MSRTLMRLRPFVLLLLVLAAHTVGGQMYSVERAGQLLEVDLDPAMSARQRGEVLAWIRGTADALADVYGHWPRDHWRVRVRNYATRGSDPVPWAQVNRGDPDVVSFYVDPAAGRQRLAQNWTAYHEFSHLLIPYRGWGDMWFSEGLASYYQNLLQARHGILDEREMWQRLYQGFMRGRSNRRPDLSLGELSPTMRENRSFMRVYWSGAWYFFKADLELRRRSGGRQSLDSALAALNGCCADRSLSAREIAVELDRLSGQRLFVPLFEQVAASYALPPFEALYSELGIEIDDGRISLRDVHPQSELRRAFARPQVPAGRYSNTGGPAAPR